MGRSRSIFPLVTILGMASTVIVRSMTSRHFCSMLMVYRRFRLEGRRAPAGYG